MERLVSSNLLSTAYLLNELSLQFVQPGLWSLLNCQSCMLCRRYTWTSPATSKASMYTLPHQLQNSLAVQHFCQASWCLESASVKLYAWHNEHMRCAISCLLIFCTKAVSAAIFYTVVRNNNSKSHAWQPVLACSSSQVLPPNSTCWCHL